MAAAPCRPNRSRRPVPGGRGAGAAMWFMYVLSWLSLFIQVAPITLAVGESARPGPARAPAPSVPAGGHITRAPGRPARPRPALRLRSAPPVPPGPASPGLGSLADRRVLPGVTKSTPAVPGRGCLRCRLPAHRQLSRPSSHSRPRRNFPRPLPPPFRLWPFVLPTLSDTLSPPG